MVEVESSTEYANILFAIFERPGTLTEISEEVGRAKPTVLRKLEVLKKKPREYIKPVERPGKKKSVKWELNKDRFVKYWGEYYQKQEFDTKTAKTYFDIWFEQISALKPMFPLTIETIGHYFLISQHVLESGESVLDLPVRELAEKIKLANLSQYKKIKRKTWR